MKPVELGTPIKVWYKPLPRTQSLPRIQQVLWPIVDIDLSHRDRRLPQPIFSLVDSGSDMSILHPEVAEMLGFNLEKLGRPMAGGKSASGDYKSWILPEPVDVDIYGCSFSFEFQVIDNPDLIWPCILGESSIFQVARLDFQKFKGYFEVRFRQDIN